MNPKLIGKWSGREILNGGMVDRLGVDNRGMVHRGMMASKT